MTIPAGEVSYSQWTGNGVADTFDYDFKISAESHLKVTTTDLGGADTVLVLSSDYTVSGVGDDGGGSITLVAGALTSGFTILLEDNVPASQEVPFGNQSSFSGSLHETAFDKVTRIARKVLGLFDFALTLPNTVQGVSTELPKPTANTLLGWNSGATAIENKVVVENGVVGDGTIITAKIADDAVNSDKLAHQLTLFKKGADIASAAALSPGSDGNYFDVTGTTGITSIDTIGVGMLLRLHFDAALTMTHSAALDLGGLDINIKAGEEVELIEHSIGNWRLLNHWGARGTWDPALWDDTLNDPLVQYGFRQGYYAIRDGFCYFTGVLDVDNPGTLTQTDQAKVGGLPFARNSTNLAGGLTCYSVGPSNIPANAYVTGEFVNNGDDYVHLWAWDSAGFQTSLLINELLNGGSGTMHFSGSYKV